jgi:DNA-binding MarR family transcriptional regulator
MQLHATPNRDGDAGTIAAVTIEAGPALDEETMAAWLGFLRVHAALVDVLGRELEREAGLPLSWYDVLVQLSIAPGGRLRMQDLAGAVVLSKSGLTRLVDRMETAGLVGRTSCPSDRRGTFAEITPAGVKVLEEARPTHHRGIEEHFAAHLGQREVAALRRATDKLSVALGLTPPASADCEPTRHA